MNELLRRLLFLPPQASTFALGVDWLHYAVISVTMSGATGVFALAVVYLVRYRQRRAGETTPVVYTPPVVERGLIGSILTLFLAFWCVGALQYDRMLTPPAGAMPVFVTAKQWMWKFTYEDGRSSLDVLTVPAHRPIELVMTSRDVIHSFYVPAFRLKHDVVPGRYYSLWFEANAPGVYDIDCAEYCGVNHSRMLGKVVVLSADAYAKWQEEGWRTGEDHDLANVGREVAARRGCLNCHTVDGQPHIGPTWTGLYLSFVRLSNGQTVLADEAYLTRSMMDPNAELVAGYKGIMPTYRGVLLQPEVAGLLEYLKELRDAPGEASVKLPRVVPQ